MSSGPIRNPRKDLHSFIDRWTRENLELSCPAIVRKVSDYEGYRVVDVQPVLQRQEQDGDIFEPSVIYRCPVALQGTLKGYLSFPIAVGDTVLISHCKQSLGEFITANSDGQILPTDDFMFGGSNAVVVGYLGQAYKDLNPNPDNFELVFNDTKLEITPDNKVTLTTPKTTTTWTSAGDIKLTNGQITLNLFADGSATFTTSSDVIVNTGGNLEITAPTVDINGTTFQAGGVVAGISSLTAGGKELVGHDHNITSGSSAPGPTGPNN